MTEETIFAAALEKPDPADRAAFLDDACRDDPDLRKRVDGLLAAHDKAGGFLNQPVAGPFDPAAGPTRTLPPVGDGPTRTHGEEGDDDTDDALGFLAPPGRPDSLGRIGHYEVLEVLGRGGFGVVFRAFDEVLQRVVAVKVLAPSLAATSPARKRFLREARSAAPIQHENVVRIHETGETPLPYLVMEFVPGETLQQRLDRTGPLEVGEAVRIARQIADGLAAAHEKGLIHRDIKPSNILIDAGPQQQVKITDFGLARAADDASLTRSGVVAGTPMYMAPEQAKGESLDHRADLFSLGSVVYAMLTGRPPFRATTTFAVLKRVAEDDPRPIREVIPEVPDWLCRVVEKLHAKNPGDRFQTAREVADLLADCEKQLAAHKELTDLSRIPAARPHPQRRRLWRFAAGLWLIAALLWAAMIFGEPAFLYATNRGELELVPQDSLVSVIVLQNDEGVYDPEKLNPMVTDWLDMRTSHTLKLPPGKYQLNAGTRPPGPRIVHWEVTTSGPLGSRTILVPGEGHMGWSVIVTVERGRRVSVRPVFRDTPPAPAVPTPAPDTNFVPLFNGKDLAGWKTFEELPGDWRVEDGILVGRDAHSYLVSDRTFGNFHLRADLRVNAPSDAGVYFRSPGRLIPNGAGGYIVGYEAQITETSGNYRTGDLCIESGQSGADGGGWHVLQKTDRALTKPGEWFHLEILAQGNLLEIRVNGQTAAKYADNVHHLARGHLALQVFTGGTVLQCRKIEVKERPTADPADGFPPTTIQAAFKRWNGVRIAPGSKASWFSDGRRIAYFRNNPHRINVYDLTTRMTTTLLDRGSEPAGIADPAVAPGKPGRVAFVISGGKGEREVWLAEGGAIRKVADGGHPSWLPDGRTLLWQSPVPLRLMRTDIDAETPRPETLTTLPPGSSFYPFFTPDGRTVAYAAADRIVVHDLQSGAVKKFPFPNGRAPKGFLGSWHPKGRYLAFGSYGVGENYGLWVVDTQTGESRQLMGGDATMPVWSPDGTRLALDLRTGGALGGLWLLDAPAWDDLPGPDRVPKLAAPRPAAAPFGAAQAKEHQEVWAKHLGVAVETTNSAGGKMVLIPPGQFLMGSPENESGRMAGEDRHEVAITKPFYLGAHPVTVGQFKAFVKDRGYKPAAEKDRGAWVVSRNGWKNDTEANWQKPGFEQTDDCPVVCVNRDDAKAFCAWLSRKEGEQYTLPTEAQWEYACRAGTQTAFSFGNDKEHLREHAWVAGVTGWETGNADWRTHPVGEKKPNAWGVFEMHGNIRNWTDDWYGVGYYAVSPRDDPTGPAGGTTRVVRGGAWYALADTCRSAYRQGTNPTWRFTTDGFRVAVGGDLKPKPPPAAVAPLGARKAAEHK